MTRDTIKWIEINWKVLDTINDNRSTFGSTKGCICDVFESRLQSNVNKQLFCNLVMLMNCNYF
jgi:hypothetical protein